jgi:hypothetical protein
MTVTDFHPIARRKSILATYGTMPKPTVKNKEWLYLLEEETRNSIMIEGYFVDKQDISQTISNTNIYTHQHQAQILGYFDAASLIYEFGYQKYIDQMPLAITHADVRTIHSLMFR